MQAAERVFYIYQTLADCMHALEGSQQPVKVCTQRRAWRKAWASGGRGLLIPCGSLPGLLCQFNDAPPDKVLSLGNNNQ